MNLRSDEEKRVALGKYLRNLGYDTSPYLLIAISDFNEEYATQPAPDGEKLNEEEIKALKREYNLETYGVISDYDRKKLWNWMLSKLNTQPAPVEAVEVKPLRCIDCGLCGDTVKDRGEFNGIQCYECKKIQDIEDEECR